jgi:hypothetical protein
LKRLVPFLLALVVITTFETIIGLVGHAGAYGTNFFDFSPLRQDVLQKHVIYDKFIRVLNIASDAVQVGDSSGFYGVIPEQVTSAGPDISYLNLSCCGDTGWNGYFYLAELAMKRTPTPRILVLHVTPFWAPAAPAFYGDNQLAMLVNDHLLESHWWNKIKPPSLGYRLRMLNLIYHGRWLDDFPYDSHGWPTVGYPPIRQWRKDFVAGRGFVPMPVDLKDPISGVCRFDNDFSEDKYLGLKHEDSLYNYLRQFGELARRHDARFVFITNPVPCTVVQDLVTYDVERQLARFKTDFPDAIIPFPFFRGWPRSEFMDRWHLAVSGATAHSRMIGEALGAALEKPPRRPTSIAQ